MIKAKKLFAFACVFCASVCSHAQLVRVVPEPFPLEASPGALPIKPLRRAASTERDSTSGPPALSGAQYSSEGATSKVVAALPTWQIDLKDIHLANTFHRWAKDAKWRVRWDARKNVLIEAPDQITGTFEEAIKTVLEAPGIANSAHPLEVCFYPNTPPLARITLKGEQEKDCQ